ncbi:MAG TPA: hypothetical protein VG367_20445 [Mucilaginibacter sp.]|nr:hypothetical protein [Mucilaginibacter sp.]
MRPEHDNTMGYFRKKIERRTFSQDRYYILIKRKRSGEATLHDLEELDEIVNRVPDIREQVILENFYSEEEEGRNTPPTQPLDTKPQPPKRRSWLEAIRSFFHRLFMVQETCHNTASLL